MIAEIASNTTIQLYNCSEYESDIIWNELSVVRPGLEHIDLEQVSLWDGVYRFYNRSRQTLARPLLSKLREICQRRGLPITIRDARPDDPYPTVDPDSIDTDFLPGITLDPWQLRGIRRACTTEIGLFDLPTGSGKGELIAGICKAIPCPTVILADQTVVIDQLESRLQLRRVTDRVGVFYSGKRPNGETIVVGSIQSLSVPANPPEKLVRLPQEDQASWELKLKKYKARLKAYDTRCRNARVLRKLVRGAHMILVDEADRAVSKPYQSLFRNVFRGRRRYGFSGTPFDPAKPVEAMRLQQHLGSTIIRESRAVIEAASRIIPVELFMMVVEGNKDDATTYDIACREHMTESPTFWQLITRIATRYPDDGTLILVDKQDLGFNLMRTFASGGKSVPFIFGETPRRVRTQVLRDFERREHKIIIGGKIINRGLDLKGGCENLILATTGKLRSAFIQQVGRAVRQNRLGRARVFGFYMRTNKYLYDHSKANLRTMIEMGYKTTIVYNGGRIDGQELVRRRFQLPRRRK